MDAAIKQLAADLLFVCYRGRRLRGETAWSLADEFSGVVVLEIRFQVEQAAQRAAREAQIQEAIFWESVDGANAYAEERE